MARISLATPRVAVGVIALNLYRLALAAADGPRLCLGKTMRSASVGSIVDSSRPASSLAAHFVDDRLDFGGACLSRSDLAKTASAGL